MVRGTDVLDVRKYENVVSHLNCYINSANIYWDLSGAASSLAHYITMNFVIYTGRLILIGQ
jgi:hypothetical protein